MHMFPSHSHVQPNSNSYQGFCCFLCTTLSYQFTLGSHIFQNKSTSVQWCKGDHDCCWDFQLFGKLKSHLDRISFILTKSVYRKLFIWNFTIIRRSIWVRKYLSYWMLCNHWPIAGLPLTIVATKNSKHSQKNIGQTGLTKGSNIFSRRKKYFGQYGQTILATTKTLRFYNGHDRGVL